MKRNTPFVKVLAIVLCAMMLLSVIPFTAFAASIEGFKSETHTVFKNTESTLAPGVTQNIKYAYAADGKQMVYYIATADVTRDDVVVQSSYYKQHEGGVMGMAKLTEQAAYANQKYTNPEDPNFISENYNVVAGTNASFYNMSTGQPLGITFIDGVSFGTNSYDNFFAILKDGKSAVIDYASNLGKYVDENNESTIWQAAAGSAWLVRDGKDVTANASGSYNTDRHSRTCVGVTAEGKVVLMVLDGRQEPFSCGGTFHELAQIMLEAGCVAAVNLDGGGSTTYASKPAGSDEFQVLNRPSDGSERAISSGLIIASTAAPSNVFESAVLTAESDYVTPGSTVKFTATGVSPAGTSAQIPTEATLQLKDASMGTLVNGTFVSNGKVGDAVIQMIYNGKVVGETTIHVVIPDIAFTSTDMTVPYGKTFTLSVVGTTNNGLNSVTMKDGDVKFALSDSKMGAVNGNKYTTCDESAGVTGGTITAKCVYDESKTATATVKFGKASQIVYDFEDGDATGWKAGSKYSNTAFGRFETAEVSIVDKTTGKVRNGKYALALTADFSTTTASGYKAVRFTLPKAIDLTGASAFGMWMYLPVDANNLEFDIGGYEFYPEKHDDIHGEGWYYISASTDLIGSSVSKFDIYMTDPDETYANIFDKFIIYIDDLTIDYSNATEDREIPLFKDVTISTGLDSFVAMNGQTINTNTFIVKASAQDDLSGNYTGLDISSAKVYVDGQLLKADQYSCDNNGVITVSDITLSDGTHTFRFEISDNNGNVGFATKQIVVKADKGDVAVVRRNDSTVQPLAGSIEYFDVVANKAENIKSITLQLDLDTLSAWELQGADVVYGFEMSYTVDVRSNTAYITLTRTDKATVSGEAVIASLPVRVWQTSSYLDPKYIEAGLVNKSGAAEGDSIWSPDIMWQTDRARYVRIELNAESIKVQYTDGTNATFSQKQINVITEYNRYRSAGYYKADGTYVTGDTTFVMQGKTSTHIHTVKNLEDKAATCTEAGYKNRTYCEVCKSVVDWGTTIKATGHSYEVVDGVLKCHCGETFSGVYTDGKTYENGVIATGWVENSYYVDGLKLTGVQKVDGYYYNFGTDGVSQGKYTGIFYDETDKVYRYAQFGELSSGWKQIDDDWYYFRQSTLAAVVGQYTYSGISYTFTDEGKLTSGVWVTNEQGTRYYYAASYYYKAGSAASVTFATINGKEYGFDKSGYMYKNGMYSLKLSNQKHLTFYTFDENGVCAGLFDLTAYTGLVKTVNEGIYYYENGVLSHAGIVKIDGNYYYAGTGGVVVTNTSKVVYPGYTNGLISPGTYEFDENGRMAYQNGVYEQDGKLYYFVNGQRTHAGMITFDGNLYYAGTGGLVVTNTSKFVYYGYANGLVPPGSYEFGDDGKLLLLNGIHERDGVLYYFLDGIKTHAGVIEIDGDYYYAATGGVIVRNTSKIIYSDYTNDLTVPGTYTFDIDGKMQCVNGVYEQNGVLYYFEKGVKTHAGIIKIDGEIYYAGTNGVVVSNATKLVYPGYTNGIIPPGTYEFDAEGKMKCANGIYEIDSVLYYFVDAVRTHAGVIQVDGCYYYAGTGGIIVRNTSKFVYFGYANGLVAPGTYEFNNDGKMIIK